MQRFFSTFPSGRPGTGLLLLRLAIGVTSASLGSLYLARAAEPPAAESIGAILAIASGLSLVIGFLTPVSGAVVTLHGVAVALSSGRPELWLFVVVASASLLLGPGAYSVDARLFGRREIVIPPTDRTQDRTSKGV